MKETNDIAILQLPLTCNSVSSCPKILKALKVILSCISEMRLEFIHKVETLNVTWEDYSTLGSSIRKSGVLICTNAKLCLVDPSPVPKESATQRATLCPWAILNWGRRHFYTLLIQKLQSSITAQWENIISRCQAVVLLFRSSTVSIFGLFSITVNQYNVFWKHNFESILET